MRAAIASIKQVDIAIDEWWEQWRGNPTLDAIFYKASEAANHSKLWHFLGLLQGIARRDRRSSAELSAVLMVEAAIVNGLIKTLFNRSRPQHLEPRPHRLRQPLTTSFPSGHASAATVAAVMLARRSRLAPLWYAAALLVAVSRIHVRLHHASDVTGGIIVGAVIAAIARRLLRR